MNYEEMKIMWPDFVFPPINLNVIGKSISTEIALENQQVPWLVIQHEREKNEKRVTK